MANPDIPKFITNDMLREIRANTDWRELFGYLGLERDRKSTERDWWANSPLNPDEKTASFHMNDQGWTCFSKNESGYVIELVQQVIGQRTGRTMNCYQAGKWLLENGLSHVALRSSNPSASGGKDERSTCNVKESEDKEDNDGTHGASEDESREGVQRVAKYEEAKQDRRSKKENLPIRQTLLPSLDMRHPDFERRGISQGTCAYLGCGYLTEYSKSPLAGRLVFQVRGLKDDAEQAIQTVILTHIGRATTIEQQDRDGKWWIYGGFSKTLELYNIDKMILDKKAVRQARDTGHVIVTEGCFDVAKLVEAGIRNVVATFGAHLAEEHISRLKQIRDLTGVDTFLFWYDRDRAGKEGQAKLLEDLEDYQMITAKTFDWDMTFPSPTRGEVKIPENIADVCEFSIKQLKWLRNRNTI